MGKLINYFIIFGISCFGCKSSKTSNEIYQDLSFQDKLLKSVYFVDTVKITDAYVYQKLNKIENIEFLTNNEGYKDGTLNSAIYLKPDVYLLSHCLYCHTKLDENIRVYDFEKCYSHSLISKDADMTIYKFDKNNDWFIIALMNISYYNNRHSSLDGSVFINASNYKSAYVKVAFPFCK